MQYEDLVQQFVYETFPSSMAATPAVRFEAVASTVLGTKQRRFGPMPSPETQVLVRNVLREAMETDEVVHFFLPWGSSKQGDDQHIDLLELTAIKQLQCLREDLLRLGLYTAFHFRVENLTDQYLFGNQRLPQIERYASDLQRVIRTALVQVDLPVPKVNLESKFVCGSTFFSAADENARVFYKYLTGNADANLLREIGWSGTIPKEQLEYYTSSYKLFYPGEDHLWKAAQYFGATLARVKLKATGEPADRPSILLAFTHPVPGNPIAKARLHYRTIPDKYTHSHKSPWLAQGYLRVGEDNSVTPRYVEPGVQLTPTEVDFGGVKVQVPYSCE